MFVTEGPKESGLVDIRDAETGEAVLSFTGHDVDINDVAFSADGSMLATAGDDGAARVWDAATGDELASLEGEGQAWGVSLSRRPLDRLGQRRRGRAHHGRGHGRAASHACRAHRPDRGHRLGPGRRPPCHGERGRHRPRLGDHRRRRSRAPRGRRPGDAGRCRSVAFSPDGERLLTGDAGVRAAKIWDVGISGGAEWANLPAPDDILGSAVFTPDGRSVVATGDGVPAVVWDVATGERKGTLGAEDHKSHPAEVDAVGIGVSPDGDLIATGTFDGPVRVWDAGTGEEDFTVGEGSYQNDGAWSPDGELLAVTSTNGERGWITIVDRSGRQVAEILEDGDHIPLAVEFTPDGERIVTTRTPAARQDATVDGLRIWDWADGEVVRDIHVWAQPLAVDPSGVRLATNDLVGGAAVWDAATGERTASLSGHTGAVYDVAFSPDGSTVATASADGTVRLWSAESGIQRLVLRGHDAPVGSVDFSPDRSQLVSVSLGEARVWALDLDDLIDIAESRLTRSLTDVECRQYLHVDRCPDA